MPDHDRFPGYDVLQKRDGPSWNDVTRRVVDARLAVPRQPRFFNESEWRTLDAVCDRILPQSPGPDKVPLPAYVDEKMYTGQTDGYRYAGMPYQGEAWRRGLAALDEAAQRAHGRNFHEIEPAQQDAMLHAMQHGEFEANALGDMPAKTFFSSRVIADVALTFYTHPNAWSEIGWAGPASPRGYVRLKTGLRDPWEPVEAEQPGDEARVRRENRRVR